MSNRKQPPKTGAAKAPPRSERRRMLAVSPELYERLAGRARENNRPIAWELRAAIEAHLGTPAEGGKP